MMFDLSYLKSMMKDETKSQEIRLVLNLIISCMSSFILFKLMPKFKDMFMRADLKGTDMSKKNKYEM